MIETPIALLSKCCRTRRTLKRANAARVRLTDRDQWLLEALAKMRFLTTTQIQTMCFGTRSATNKCLRRLLNAGLVRVWVRSLSGDNVYSLANSGRLVLANEGAADERYRVPRGLDRNLEHLLAINTVRVHLARGLDATGGAILSWRSDWELRTPRLRRIVPDAHFDVGWDDQVHATFALEVEHQTRTPQRFLKKVYGYTASHWQPSDTPEIVLVVGHDPVWLERYRARVAHVRASLPVWFASLHDVTSDPTGAIWRAAASAVPHSLRELAGLPYSKEGTPGENVRSTRGKGPPDARLLPSPSR